MPHRPMNHFCGFLGTAALALVLIGCNGKTGQNGLNGTNGTNGTNGINGTNGTGPVVTLNAAALSTEGWSKLSLKGAITAVTLGSAPSVTFTITDALGTPVVGLAETSASGAFAHFGFAVAKLVPADPALGSPSRWVNYMVVTTPPAGGVAVPGWPHTENTGNLKDNLDGSYTYTAALDLTKAKSYVDGAAYDATHLKADLGDLTYDPTLTHRVVVTMGGYKLGTTVLARDTANLVFDLVPATGKAVAAADPQRLIVDTASCNSCHTKLSLHAAQFPPIQDARLCALCHTDQLKYGSGESLPPSGTVLLPAGLYGSTQRLQGMALADFPNMIHKLHTGELLYYQGYNQFFAYNHVTYPQDLRNCVKCHTAALATTPQGDNWNTTPSRLACGGCHDRVIWATGAYHDGGAQTSDQNCTGCHGAVGVKLVHVPEVRPDANNVMNGGTNANTNASFVAAYTGNLPAGALKPTWDLASLTVNASQQPVFKFRFLLDGAPATFNPQPATADATVELLPGFVGGPSAYVVFAVPQDGVARPADFNAAANAYIRNVWNRTVGTSEMTGPDVGGYYTLTLKSVVIPATATMITGGIGYAYNLPNTQPLTQINLPDFPYNTDGKRQGGLTVPALNATKLVSGPLPVGFGSQGARRTIVSNAKCNDCHAVLGVFTEKAYHAGQRNDAVSCAWCHTVNRANNGWSVNAKDAVHALHAPAMRENKFSWHADVTQLWKPTYPALLNNCEACHLVGTYDFTASASASAVPNLLASTTAYGDYKKAVDGTLLPAGSTLPVVTTGSEPFGNYYAPFVAWGNYGTQFTFAAATGVSTEATPTTLVVSPISAACFACHDSGNAVAHMRGNGGSVYDLRSSYLANVEQCLICHGAGRTADIKAAHMTFK